MVTVRRRPDVQGVLPQFPGRFFMRPQAVMLKRGVLVASILRVAFRVLGKSDSQVFLFLIGCVFAESPL